MRLQIVWQALDVFSVSHFRGIVEMNVSPLVNALHSGCWCLEYRGGADPRWSVEPLQPNKLGISLLARLRCGQHCASLQCIREMEQLERYSRC